MKFSKPALKTSTQEECGVWLDTAQLKGQAKQKRPARPISKLLNPFVGGGGYNLAVALNFTQTKFEMPKTKQSSLSSFFTAQRRVLNKMSTTEVPCMDPVQPSPSSSSTATAPTPVASGTKRKREIDLDLCKYEPDVEREWKNEDMPKEWQDQAADHTQSQNMFCESEEEQIEEINPPQSKRRHTATSSVPGDSQPVLLAWSQDPLFTYSQYSEGEFHSTKQENTTAKDFSDSFMNTLRGKEAFGIRMDAEMTTSTQKSFKHTHSSQVDDEKENSRLLSSKSPNKRLTLSRVEPLSNHKWTESKTASPSKYIPGHLSSKADEEDGHTSQFKWAKPRSSPLKKAQPSFRVVDEDSLSMLFTQDSEGFRVIAHRGEQARSALSDQSNRSTWISSAYKSLVEEDEEDEMLFTQDSQGNLVIKH